MPVAQGSTVRWFHSQMANAPQINANATSELINILDACLIDGFDPRTPDGDNITIAGEVATVHFSGGHDFEKHAVIEISGATTAALNDVWRVTGATATTFTFACPGIADGQDSGTITVKRATPGFWEKAFSGTNKAAYRSTHLDATGLYLRLDDVGVSTQSSRVRGYEVMTDIDTGSRPFPTFAQVLEARYRWHKATHASTRPWILVADEAFFYLIIRFSTAFPNGPHVLCFGDIVGRLDDAFRCVMVGNNYNSDPVIPDFGCQFWSLNNNFATGCYFARDKDGNESNPPLFRRFGAGSLTNWGGGVSYPAWFSGGYLFSPVWASSDGHVRGRVPGGLQSWTKHPDTIGADFYRIIDPGVEMDVAVLLCLAPAINTEFSHMGIDIWGPWR